MDRPTGSKHCGGYNVQGSPLVPPRSKPMPPSSLAVHCLSPVPDTKHGAEQYDLWGGAPVSREASRGHAFDSPRQQSAFPCEGVRPPSLRRTHILPFNDPLELPFQVAVKALVRMSATPKRVYPGRCFYADKDVCSRLARSEGSPSSFQTVAEANVYSGSAHFSEGVSADELENSVFLDQDSAPPPGRRWALFAVVACDPPTGAVFDSNTFIFIDGNSAARPLRRVQLLALVYNSSWARRSGFPKGVRPMSRRREMMPGSSDSVSPSQDAIDRDTTSGTDGAMRSDSVRDVLEPFSGEPFFMPDPAEPVPSHTANDGTGRLAALHLPVQKYSLPLTAGVDARIAGMAGGACASEEDLWSLPGLFNTLAVGAQRMFEVLQEVTQVRHALVDEELLFYAHVVPYLRQDIVLYHGKIFMSHGVYFLVAAADAGNFEGIGYVTSETKIYLNVDPFGEFNSVEVLPFKQQFKIHPFPDEAGPTLGGQSSGRHVRMSQSATLDCPAFSMETAGPEQVGSADLWETHIKPFLMSLGGRTRPFFKGEVFTIGGINFKVCYAEPSWPLHGAARIGPETEIYCEGTVALSLADAFALALPKDWEAIRSSPAYMQQRLIMEAFPRLPQEAQAILSSYAPGLKICVSKSGMSAAEGKGQGNREEVNEAVHSQVFAATNHCEKREFGMQSVREGSRSASGALNNGVSFPCITNGRYSEASVAVASSVAIPKSPVCDEVCKGANAFVNGALERIREPASKSGSAGQLHRLKTTCFPDNTARAANEVLSYAEPNGLAKQQTKSSGNVTRPVRWSKCNEDSVQCSFHPATQDSDCLETSLEQKPTCRQNYQGSLVVEKSDFGCKSNCESVRPTPGNADRSLLPDDPSLNEDSQVVHQTDAEGAEARWLQEGITAIGTSTMVAAEPYFVADAPVCKGNKCLEVQDDSSSLEALLIPKQGYRRAEVNASETKGCGIGSVAPDLKEGRNIQFLAASDPEAKQSQALLLGEIAKQPPPPLSSRGSGRTLRPVVCSRGKYPPDSGTRNQCLEDSTVPNSPPSVGKNNVDCKASSGPTSVRSRGAAFL